MNNKCIRIISVLLLTLMLFSISACGKNPGAGQTSNETAETPAEAGNAVGLGSELTGKGGSGIYLQKDVSIPDADISIHGAAVSGEYIYICAKTQEQKGVFYTPSSNMTALIKTPIEVNADFVHFCCSENGDIAVLTYTAPPEGGGENHIYTVNEYNKNGELIRQTALDEVLKLDNTAVNSMIYCDRGILLSLFNSLVLLESSGNASKVIDGLGSPRQLVYSADNKILAIGGGANGYSAIEITKDLSTKTTYPLNSEYIASYNGKGSESVLLRDGTTLYAVDYKTNERRDLISLVKNGITSSYYIRISDTAFLGSAANKPVLIIEQDEGIEVKVIKLATYDMSIELPRIVASFNGRSAEYKIDIIDYASLPEAGGISGLDKLNTDIIAGNLPDIFDLSRIDRFKLQKNEVLEDLLPYFEKSDINYSDLSSCIKSVSQVGDKAYSFIPGFKVSTYVAKSGIVKGEKLTPGEFVEIANSGEAAMFWKYMTRNDFISELLMYAGNDFLNMESGECSFNSQSFISLLEYSKTLPDKVSSGGEEKWDDEYYLNGEVNLYHAEVNDFALNGKAQADTLFGGSSDFVGFPCEGSFGSAITPFVHLGMSRSSAVKDGVWEFYKHLLSSGYQEEMIKTHNLPAFEKRLSELIDTNYKNLLQDPPKINFPTEHGEFNGEIKPTEKTIQEVKALLAKTNKILEYDKTVYDIVSEEANAFYAGTITAEKAADNIQARVGIYLSEQG